MENETEVIRLANGHEIRIAAGLDDSEVNRIVQEYLASDDAKSPSPVTTRSVDEQLASNKRRDDFIAQQEARDNLDPQARFDQVRPRYLDNILGEDSGRSFDAGMMGWAEQSQDIIRGFKNLFADEEESEQLELEAQIAETFGQETYRGSNGFATDVGEFATTAPSLFLPGRLLVQSLLGGAEAAIDQNAGDNMAIDFGVGTATAGAFGKMFDLAGRLVGNAYKGFRGDGTLTGELGETQQKAVDFADREGIDTLPSQRTGNSAREQYEAKVESQPYGQRFRDIRSNQEREFNRIFFERFGVDGATEFSEGVRKAVDERITKAFNEVKSEIPTTRSDDAFLDGVTEITTRRTLTPEQVKILEDTALDVADGMPAQQLLDTRKELQTAVVDNFNNNNSIYAGALRDMVDEIDNLVERTASAETALKFADARDMSRMRMALEMGAGTNAKGELNHTSLANRLFKIYRNELGRGRGGLRPDTQRSVDAAQAASVFKTGVGNSGTTTRGMQDLSQTAVDFFVRGPASKTYLEAPYLYGSFDPMSQLATSVANKAGNAASVGYQEAVESPKNLLGIK